MALEFKVKYHFSTYIVCLFAMLTRGKVDAVRAFEGRPSTSDEREPP